MICLSIGCKQSLMPTCLQVRAPTLPCYVKHAVCSEVNNHITQNNVGLARTASGVNIQQQILKLQ